MRLSVSRPLVATLALLSLGLRLTAEDDFLVGPRATGMAGANTASADDEDAQYYNPAAFGFMDHRTKDNKRLYDDNNDLGRKVWGFDPVDVTVQVQIQGQMANYLQTLSSSDYKNLSSTGIQNVSDAESLVSTADALANIANPGNAITASETAGVSLRIGHWCLGAREYGEATARVSKLDLTNVGLPSVADLNSQISTAGLSGSGAPAVFTPAEVAQLTAAGLNANSIGVLEKAASADNVSSSDVSQLVSLLSSVAQATSGVGGGPLADNQTSLLLKGFVLGEVPLSYGREINEHFSVGASLKLMIGRVYGATVLVFQDDATHALQDAVKNYKQTINAGLDVGAMYRVRYLQVGVMARDINSPVFKGPTYDGISYGNVRVTPQVTLGAAFIPFRTFALEGDCDLAKTDTTLDGFYQQRLRFGGEWNILHFLALRGGVYKNIAENSTPWVATGGVGLDLWLLRVDLGGAYSLKTVDVQGHSVPEEAAASLGVRLDY